MVSTQPTAFSKQIEALEKICQDLIRLEKLTDKIAYLDKRPLVGDFLEKHPLVKSALKDADPEKQYAMKCVIAIGQGDVVFHNFETLANPKESIRALSEKLWEIERFYDSLGGLPGYQLAVLQLLEGIDLNHPDGEIQYDDPAGTDLTVDSATVDLAVKWGIDTLDSLGEIYPLGGAGDRLNLTDPLTGEPLPVAQLIFGGRTLLESMVRDLQGREHLYYKLFGNTLITPIAIMTSHEKDNNRRIIALCEQLGWFGRPKESFKFFIQPLVPMVAYDGLWAVKGPMQPILKPGGHGVMWKSAEDAGVFDWFEGKKRKKAIIRQINNPMAGVDIGLLAFAGIGCRGDKAFGFASCDRVVGASEGMNVVRTVLQDGKYDCCLTNIEYTEFKKCGIDDVPKAAGSEYSRYPSNTNILFADLEAVREALETCTIPGEMINMKSKVICQGPEGVVEKHAGRLESTMQNIADCIVDTFSAKPKKSDYRGMRTFLTNNIRRKTISVVKQKYVPGGSLMDTPVCCFYDSIANYRDLLGNYCGIELPPKREVDEYLSNGPEMVVAFHPALGPLFSVIGQKISGGRVAEGSEWVMEVAEALVKNIDLSGSLIVEAENVMGRKDAHGVITYDSEHAGKCTLINVTVRNGGAAPFNGLEAWRCDWPRKEALRITLRGNAEFHAQNVLLEGDIHYDVPEGYRLVVYSHEGETAWYMEKLSRSTWHWEYSIDSKGRIGLEKSK